MIKSKHPKYKIFDRNCIRANFKFCQSRFISFCSNHCICYSYFKCGYCYRYALIGQ